MNLDWLGGFWYWLLVWWMVWAVIFLGWYDRQIKKESKEPVSPTEAFFMILFSGLGPIFAILIIIGKAIALSNEDDRDK